MYLKTVSAYSSELDAQMYLLYSNSLDLLMRKASRDKDFVIGAQLQRQLTDLKEEQREQHERAFYQKQADELNALTYNYENDYRVLNQSWNDKMNTFCDAVEAALTEMLQRHAQEQDSQRKKLESQFPPQPKFTPKYLSLCRTREVLARELKFTDAILVEQEIKALYDKETTQWDKARKAKISKHLQNLAAKQRREHETFLQKNEVKFANSKKQRAVDVEE